MKFLIWFICFLPVAIIQVSLKEAGISLGAIPVLVLFSIALWCEKKLNATWDRRKASKATSEHQDSPVTSPDILAASTEPSPTITDPAAPAPATPKLRYCKHCGSPIDPATHQCTGCGKQYFRPPVLRKKHLALSAGVLACAVFAILTFSLASRLNAAQSQISELNTEIAELKHSVQQYEHNIKSYATNESYYDKQLKAKTKRIDELLDENAMYREYLDYCEYYCAYITITGGKISSSIYHRLDCPYTEAADSLGILYIEFLESRDFTPCPYCYG